MSGLFGIGGSKAKTDRKYELASMGELQNLFGAESKAGQGLLDTGTADVGKSKDYWSALMSGDPTKMSAVLAPQISTLKKQSGQAIGNIQQFGDRSGGNSGAVVAQNSEALSSIQNLFDMLGPMAAEQFTKLAGFEVGSGESLLGMAGNSAATTGEIAQNARLNGDQKAQNDQQGAILSTLGSIFGL